MIIELLRPIKAKGRLEERGTPKQILDMPGIGMDFIATKLEKWGLI